MNTTRIAIVLIALGLPGSALADKWGANEKLEAIFIDCKISEIDVGVANSGRKLATSNAVRSPKISLSARLCKSLVEDVRSFRAKNGYDVTVPVVAMVGGVKSTVSNSNELERLLARATKDNDLRRIDYLNQQKAFLKIKNIFPITLTPGSASLVNDFQKGICSSTSYDRWLEIQVNGVMADVGAKFKSGFRRLNNQTYVTFKWRVRDMKICYPNIHAAGGIYDAVSEEELVQATRDRLFVSLASGPDRYLPESEAQ